MGVLRGLDVFLATSARFFSAGSDAVMPAAVIDSLDAMLGRSLGDSASREAGGATVEFPGTPKSAMKRPTGTEEGGEPWN